MQEMIIKYSLLVAPYLQRFRHIIIGVVVIGVFAFAVVRIDGVLQTERDEDAFNLQRTEIKAVKFDEGAVNIIRNLERSDAEINGEINQDRTNPFAQ